MASVDASNSCIPIASPLEALAPPLPTTVRGEPCVLDGHPGRINTERPILLYGSGRLVIVRELGGDVLSSNGDNDASSNTKIQAFVYRGHMATVTCAKFSPSGCYVASADCRGKLRVWSFDNEEHLCKLDLNVLTGPIRDISWDMDSKRVRIVVLLYVCELVYLLLLLLSSLICIVYIVSDCTCLDCKRHKTRMQLYL